MAAVTNITNVLLLPSLEEPKMQALLPKPRFLLKILAAACQPSHLRLRKAPGNQMGPAVSILSLALSCSCAGCGVSPGCPSLIWSQLQRISKKFFEVFGICMVSFLSFYAWFRVLHILKFFWVILDGMWKQVVQICALRPLLLFAVRVWTLLLLSTLWGWMRTQSGQGKNNTVINK